jgi:hypothetical protein
MATNQFGDLGLFSVMNEDGELIDDYSSVELATAGAKTQVLENSEDSDDAEYIGVYKLVRVVRLKRDVSIINVG